MPVICLVKKGSFTLVGVCDGSGRGFTEVQWGTKSNMVYNFKVQVSWGGWGGGGGQRLGHHFQRPLWNLFCRIVKWNESNLILFLWFYM